MRVQIRLSGPAPESAGETTIFTGAFLPRHNWSSSVAASLFFHFVLIVFLPILVELLGVLKDSSAEIRGYVVEPLRFRAPERIYFAPAPAPPPRTPELSRAAARKPQLQTTRAMLEVPILPEPPKIKSTVVQPLPLLADALRAIVPEVAAWTPAPPKVKPKQFILPARTEAPKQAPVLDAPPRLDVPNREPRIADLNIVDAPGAMSRPALPVPPSSTTPVRIAGAGPARNEAVGGSLDSTLGEPANLIALGPSGIPPGSYVTLPPVAQRTPAAALPLGAGGGTGDGLGSSARGGSAAAVEPEPAAPPVRIVRPRNGRFSFVVTGSSPEESFPEAKGILSGKLVYTVYLRIGKADDWVLQYCLSGTGRGSTAAINPPYPFVMLRPKFSFESATGRLLVHGTISSDGRLEGLALAGEARLAAKETLFSSLQQWEFRPALRDGLPAEVEILLIIPRQEP